MSSGSVYAVYHCGVHIIFLEFCRYFTVVHHWEFCEVCFVYACLYAVVVAISFVVNYISYCFCRYIFYQDSQCLLWSCYVGFSVQFHMCQRYYCCPIIYIHIYNLIQHDATPIFYIKRIILYLYNTETSHISNILQINTSAS